MKISTLARIDRRTVEEQNPEYKKWIRVNRDLRRQRQGGRTDLTMSALRSMIGGCSRRCELAPRTPAKDCVTYVSVSS